MANIETNRGVFEDLGRFKSKKCKKVMGISVCEVKFEEGKVTLTEKELKKICRCKKKNN